jgi:hypothetical protein
MRINNTNRWLEAIIDLASLRLNYKECVNLSQGEG